MSKQDMLEHGKGGAHHLFNAGIALFDTLKCTEHSDFDAALTPLEQAQNETQDAVAKFEALLGEADEAFGRYTSTVPEHPNAARGLYIKEFGLLQQYAEISQLSVLSRQTWKSIKLSSMASCPVGGYELARSFIKRLSDCIEGLAVAIRRGDRTEFLREQISRTLACLFRAVSLLNCISFINRNTSGHPQNAVAEYKQHNTTAGS